MKRTYVSIVLDKSGSMNRARNITMRGFNEQVQAIKSGATEDNKTFVSLITFNDDTHCVYTNRPVEEVYELTNEDYEPRGTTALYDAVGLAIEQLITIPEMQDKDSSALVIIITDGEENSSNKVKQADLAEKIQQLQNTQRWTFTYIGANTDLSVIQETLNIKAGNISAYSDTMEGRISSFNTVTNATATYMSARGMGLSSVENFYDAVKEEDKNNGI